MASESRLTSKRVNWRCSNRTRRQRRRGGSACKRLAIDGSNAAVPCSPRRSLLHDPDLASWAQRRLEAIPGAEADRALRTEAGLLQGKLLIGTLNSIGVRRDAAAVDMLAAPAA